MEKSRIRLAYCPTRRDVFSRSEAIKFNEEIRRQMEEFAVDVVDLEGINEEKILFQDCDIQAVIDRFEEAKVDAVFFPHCNFGSENRVAQVAKALYVPVLIWGPRDDAPDESGLRSRDSQCGMFATGKVLRRYNVPFTYLTNSWIGSQEFKDGMRRFIAVANVVKAAGMGETTPFFADITVRHPSNDNAELLWHCGNFPYSLAKDKSKATVGGSVYHGNQYGIGEWELQEGDITIARFDGDHGNYQLLIGEAHTTEGPENVGSYVWIEVNDWKVWEHKLVEGPYIHHVSGIYGKRGEILLEACKYIPALSADVVEPEMKELSQRWF